MYYFGYISPTEHIRKDSCVRGVEGISDMSADARLVESTKALREEQDRWNDLFATKLIEVLDKIDAVRSQVTAGQASAAASLRLANAKAEEAHRDHELVKTGMQRTARRSRQLAVWLVVSAVVWLIFGQIMIFYSSGKWARWAQCVLEVLPLLIALRVYREVQRER